MSENVATELEKLAHYVFHLELADVPIAIRTQMRFDLLDSLGCGVYGSTTPWSGIVRRHATAWGGDDHATIWGSSARANCGRATLTNGTAAQSLEFDNSHTPLGLHLGCSVLPAAVAVAEMTNASGGALLAALISGYEVAIRVRGAMDFSHITKGFNSTGTCGGFGAAAAVGKLIGLSTEQLMHAMAIAGVNSVGIQAAQFSMSKRLMAPRSAEIGLDSAFLAAGGFTGSRNLLEAELGGFFRCFSDGFDATAVSANLGSVFGISGMGIKPYPSSHGTHAALDGARALKVQHGFDAATIRSVRVKLPPKGAETKRGWEVTDIPSALHDVRFTVAVMLAFGDFTVQHLVESVLRDPTIATLMTKIHIVASSELGDAVETRWSGQVEVELEDGSLLSGDIIWQPSGTPQNPLSTDDIVKKFRSLADPVLGVERAQRVVENVVAVDQTRDVNQLTQMLVA